MVGGVVEGVYGFVVVEYREGERVRNKKFFWSSWGEDYNELLGSWGDDIRIERVYMVLKLDVSDIG